MPASLKPFLVGFLVIGCGPGSESSTPDSAIVPTEDIRSDDIAVVGPDTAALEAAVVALETAVAALTANVTASKGQVDTLTARVESLEADRATLGKRVRVLEDELPPDVLATPVDLIGIPGESLGAALSSLAEAVNDIPGLTTESQLQAGQISALEGRADLNETCPLETERVGTVCIEVAARPKNDWFGAVYQCFARGGRLCSPVEFVALCTEAGSQIDTGGELEYSSALTLAPSGFTNVLQLVNTTQSSCGVLNDPLDDGLAKAYRCCYDRHDPLAGPNKPIP